LICESGFILWLLELHLAIAGKTGGSIVLSEERVLANAIILVSPVFLKVILMMNPLFDLGVRKVLPGSFLMFPTRIIPLVNRD
jgi:hypothetical protein